MNQKDDLDDLINGKSYYENILKEINKHEFLKPGLFLNDLTASTIANDLLKSRYSKKESLTSFLLNEVKYNEKQLLNMVYNGSLGRWLALTKERQAELIAKEKEYQIYKYYILWVLDNIEDDLKKIN